MSQEKRPTAEQMAKFKKNSQDQSLSAEIRAKFQAIVDKFTEDVEGGDEPKKRGRKPSATRATRKPAAPRATKKTTTDVEQAKAEIKAKTGKTEAECEAIIEQYRALRTKAQEGKRKAEQASATNKKRVEKLDQKGDLIEGTNVKTADAVIESTAKDVAEKIEQQIEAVEEKAEKEAKAEVAKDKTIKTTTEKKEAVEAKVEKKVKEKTKTIVKRVVIDTSALLTSIADSLGKFDKDSQKEFLIKLRSDIDKLLAKYAFGGMTDGATQVMNVQQSNLSASSVNPTLFAKGGGVGKRGGLFSVGDKVMVNDEGYVKSFHGFDLTKPAKIISKNKVKLDGKINYTYGLEFADGRKPFNNASEKKLSLVKFADGGMVGQEIVFDDNGEENTGVIKDITNLGDYVVKADDGRTLLAQRDLDVISFGAMRQQGVEQRKKRFGFFEDGGGVDGKIAVKKIDKVVQHYDGKTWELDKYPAYIGGSAKEWLGKYPIDLEDAKALVFELAADEAYDYEEEINNAESIQDLMDVIYDFKNFQRDNTYNQSWWGGVVDWGSLTENGDAYDRALVFVKMHEGGDVRGNYSELKAFELDDLAEDFPPYFARLTYYIDTPQGTLTLDTENMEGYTLVVNEDETGTYEEGDYVTLDELSESFDLSGHTLYAKGGMTQHGLRVGDRIVKTLGYEEIGIRDEDNKRHIVNLDKGVRGKGFRKGGNVSSMLRNRRGM